MYVPFERFSSLLYQDVLLSSRPIINERVICPPNTSKLAIVHVCSHFNIIFKKVLIFLLPGIRYGYNYIWLNLGVAIKQASLKLGLIPQYRIDKVNNLVYLLCCVKVGSDLKIKIVRIKIVRNKNSQNLCTFYSPQSYFITT